jgi:hypothetical protein
MRCEDAALRLPDDSPEVLDHLSSCGACQARAAAFDRDADRLVAGLRTQAGTGALGARVLGTLSARPARTAARRWVPLSVAAAMLLGVLALIFAPPPTLQGPGGGASRPVNPLDKPALLVIHGEAEGDLQIIPTDRVVSGQVVKVEKDGRVTVSVGSSDGLAGGEALAVYRRIHGGYSEVGMLRLGEIGESISRGRLADPGRTPQAGDLVVMGQPLNAGEKRALLEYVLSFRLRGANEASPYDPLVRRAGLEHDVEFLSRLKDPRAYDRLARILSGVAPFDREGLPPAGPELSARMHEWWAQAKERVRWDAGLDCYLEPPH